MYFCTDDAQGIVDALLWTDITVAFPDYPYDGSITFDDGDGLVRSGGGTKPDQFLPFEKAVRYARSLQLNDVTQWRDWCNSGARPVNLKLLRRAPFCQNGAKSGFEMCLVPAPWVLGPKHVSNPD